MSVTMECGECGVEFCMPDRLYEERKEDHQTFYCPNGHPRYFPGKSEKEKLREKVTYLENQVSYWRGRARSAEDAHEHALKVAWGYKGAMRKAQREAGIIPISDADAA